MQKLGWPGLLVMGLALLMPVASPGWAQGGRGLHYSTLFNPRTVVAVTGEVVRVEHTSGRGAADYCMHALLATPEGQLTAILAPRGYMQEKGLAIAPHDRVTVTGSVIEVFGKLFLLVMEVSGDRTMKLREGDGRPVWTGGGDGNLRGDRQPPSAVTHYLRIIGKMHEQG